MTAPTQRYAPAAILLHWVIALLIFGAFAIGLKLWGMPLSPAKFKWMAWHKWLGVVILLLVVLRILVRLRHPAPALPAHMSSNERHITHLGHLALYLLMLAVPLSGWAMSSAYGIPVVLFGVLPLPELLARDLTLAANIKLLHQGMNLALALCIVGHVLAALKHHFIDRDGLLDRMRPARQPQKEIR